MISFLLMYMSFKTKFEFGLFTFLFSDGTRSLLYFRFFPKKYILIQIFWIKNLIYRFDNKE